MARASEWGVPLGGRGKPEVGTRQVTVGNWEQARRDLDGARELASGRQLNFRRVGDTGDSSLLKIQLTRNEAWAESIKK